MKRPKSENPGRLTLLCKMGYGAGDFGFNLFFTTAQLYLFYYYTDILGLAAGVAGIVFAAPLIWDAIFDPLMGYVANRTRSRWGRYRPFLVFGAVPLAASWALMFVPTGFTGTTLILFALATHILFRTFYAVVSMPYLALSAAMTSDSAERSELAGFRMFAVAICGLLSATLTLQLVEMFGGGQSGFFRVAILYSSLAVLLFFFTFSVTRESAEVPDEEAPSLREMAAMLAHNKPFWIAAAAMGVCSIASTMNGKFIPYFFKYVVGDESLIGPALGALTALFLVSVPIWTFLMKRSSKRRIWLASIGVSMLSSTLFYLAPNEAALAIPALALGGVALGGIATSFWAAMPDTVEYGEWRSGIRAEGAIFGFVSLIQKSGLGLAAILVGFLLELIGYQANQVQSVETLDGIKFLMVVGPLALNAAAIVVIIFYRLGPKQHAKIVDELRTRREAIS